MSVPVSKLSTRTAMPKPADVIHCDINTLEQRTMTSVYQMTYCRLLPIRERGPDEAIKKQSAVQRVIINISVAYASTVAATTNNTE